MTSHQKFIWANEYLVALILIAVGFTVFQGCAVPYTYSYLGHTTFTVENTNRLRTGMAPNEV